MEQQQKKKISVLGLILVILGVALLLKHLQVIRISGGQLFWIGVGIYGAVTVIRAYLYETREKIYFGSLCFFTGILFALHSYNLIEGSVSFYLSSALIIFGLSFVTLYLFNYNDWHLLIPASIFLCLGAAFMMTEMGYWYSVDVFRIIKQYWPVLLILVGISMMFRKRKVY